MTTHLLDLVERGLRLHPCPGWKRACGVTTPREWCFYCTKSRELEKAR